MLTFAWSMADWARLSALILPDPDDMMRLMQIRDWIGGQAFDDVTQYRLGGGLAMHWSRLPDLVPAALIRLIEPIAGRRGAELTAVIVWPALLFAMALALLADIARRLDGRPAAGLVALLLGALAYPATGLFMPGRIDHHALQLVLLLIEAWAMLAGSRAGVGAIAGLVIAASLAIGLESAPLSALILAVLTIRWVADDRGAVLAAAGAALGGATTLAAWLLAPRIWPTTLCDAFTPPVAVLGVAAGTILFVLGLAARFLASWQRRLAALVLAGLAGLMLSMYLAPACLAGPYGAVPPLLRTLWLDHVAEAQPLLSLPLADLIGYGGLMIAGLAVAGARLIRGRRDAASLAWFALLAGTALLSCIQLRLAPFGAALAIPVMAAMVVVAREDGRTLAKLAAWVISAGILYPLAGGAFAQRATAPPRAPCVTQANLDRIAASGPGGIAVPLDMGAYVLAASANEVLAAPYHRNGAANLAHYRLFLADPGVAQAAARRWQVRTIAYCPGWVADLDLAKVAAKGSIVELARTGKQPVWTRTVHASRDLVILRVNP